MAGTTNTGLSTDDDTCQNPGVLVKFIESERDAATAPFLTSYANKTCRCWHLRMQGTETELQRRLQVLDRLAQSSDRTREDRALPHMADLTGPGGGLSTHSVARGATDPTDCRHLLENKWLFE